MEHDKKHQARDRPKRTERDNNRAANFDGKERLDFEHRADTVRGNPESVRDAIARRRRQSGFANVDVANSGLEQTISDFRAFETVFADDSIAPNEQITPDGFADNPAEPSVVSARVADSPKLQATEAPAFTSVHERIANSRFAGKSAPPLNRQRGTAYSNRFAETATVRGNLPPTEMAQSPVATEVSVIPDPLQGTESSESQISDILQPESKLSAEHSVSPLREGSGRLQFHSNVKPAKSLPQRNKSKHFAQAREALQSSHTIANVTAPMLPLHNSSPKLHFDNATEVITSQPPVPAELFEQSQNSTQAQEPIQSTETMQPQELEVSEQPNTELRARPTEPRAETHKSPLRERSGGLRFDDKTKPNESAPQSRPAKPGAVAPANKSEGAPAQANANSKAAQARAKAERSEKKLAKATDKLPKKRKLKFDKTIDTESGKVRHKLHFETSVKSQNQHLKGAAVARPFKALGNSAVSYGHRKISQVEHENIGVEAAHKVELTAESALRSAYRHHKAAPYRKVQRLEQKTSKLRQNANFRQAVADNPKLQSNALSRAAQKRKVKKGYAKAAREAQKNAKRAKQAGSAVSRAAQAVAKAISSHPVVVGVIAGLLLIVMLISSVFASCSNIASGIGSAVAGVSYQAEDADIDNAELAYTEWETDLQIEIASTETDYPGYDEYRYYVGDISHNPYELMAYLTAKFQNFTYPNIEAELQSLFAEQYTLTYTPSVEVRYADPDDSDEDGDYEAYDWNVLTVSLTARSFTDVVHSRLDTEQRQHYDALMRTKGARQYVENPLDFGWLPYVSSGYGYRVHPISGAKNYHKGIDIAIPVGTELHAGFDGTVTIGYDAGGYGNYVTLTSADGLVANYAHLDSVLVSDGQAVVSGDIIALSGNSGNSTGPHLHLEVIKNAVYLNPSYFVDTGSYSLSPIYGDPGMPMGDGK